MGYRTFQPKEEFSGTLSDEYADTVSKIKRYLAEINSKLEDNPDHDTLSELQEQKQLATDALMTTYGTLSTIRHYCDTTYSLSERYSVTQVVNKQSYQEPSYVMEWDKGDGPEYFIKFEGDEESYLVLEPDKYYDPKALIRILWHVIINKLTDKQRDVLAMKYFSEGKVTQQEMASILDVSQQAVSEQLDGAETRLKKELDIFSMVEKLFVKNTL